MRATQTYSLSGDAMTKYNRLTVDISAKPAEGGPYLSLRINGSYAALSLESTVSRELIALAPDASGKIDANVHADWFAVYGTAEISAQDIAAAIAEALFRPEVWR
jgi:hypothetical protein